MLDGEVTDAVEARSLGLNPNHPCLPGPCGANLLPAKPEQPRVPTSAATSRTAPRGGSGAPVAGWAGLSPAGGPGRPQLPYHRSHLWHRLPLPASVFRLQLPGSESVHHGPWPHLLQGAAS
ncbi:rCG24586 [Rattus norvegicus]|uniref:RCG24586 n=1 Tax=Rattus norvegicus TaxID=10116 RepID=A6JCC1_RAT|nr:rCG24586 [Rattus norvegicus]